MGNIIDYASNKDAKSFDEVPFNDADGMIFSALSYLSFNDCGIGIDDGAPKSISEIYQVLDRTCSEDEKNKDGGKNSYQLLKALNDNPRFKDVKLSNYVENPVKSGVNGFTKVKSESDSEIEQFAAVTLSYKENGKDYNFMSFKGTDGTLNGWNEDFLMLSSTGTQAQRDAVNYMNIVGRKVDGYLTGGGHSKGGNDFEYGYLFCNEDARNRITNGYLYDSPGVHDDVISKTSNYDRFLSIVFGHVTRPQDSLVGNLLHEVEGGEYVYSDGDNFFSEHGLFTWQMDPITGEFEAAEQSDFSKFINQLLDTSIYGMTLEERKVLYGFVYYIFKEYEARSGNTELDDLIEDFLKDWKTEDGSINFKKFEYIWVDFSIKWDQMTPEERKAFENALGSIICALYITADTYRTNSRAVAKSGQLYMYITKQMNHMEEAFISVSTELQRGIVQGAEKIDSIFRHASHVFVSHVRAIEGWYVSVSYSYSVPSGNGIIELDTAAMREYATRLNSVNKRIDKLDKRMDALYKKVGLRDLFKLLKADLMTGYSRPISNCAKYLNQTAEDFEGVEKDIASQYLNNLNFGKGGNMGGR